MGIRSIARDLAASPWRVPDASAAEITSRRACPRPTIGLAERRSTRGRLGEDTRLRVLIHTGFKPEGFIESLSISAPNNEPGDSHNCS